MDCKPRVECPGTWIQATSQILDVVGVDLIERAIAPPVYRTGDTPASHWGRPPRCARCRPVTQALSLRTAMPPSRRRRTSLESWRVSHGSVSLAPIRRFGPDLRDEVREIELPASVVGAATLLSARRLCQGVYPATRLNFSLIFWEFSLLRAARIDEFGHTGPGCARRSKRRHPTIKVVRARRTGKRA
jgi:hypothetical protein